MNKPTRRQKLALYLKSLKLKTLKELNQFEQITIKGKMVVFHTTDNKDFTFFYKELGF